MNSSNEKTASLAGHDETVIGQIRASGRARSRWAVHLALLITIIVALAPLLLFHVNPRVTVHVVIAWTGWFPSWQRTPACRCLPPLTGSLTRRSG
jgi:hypothetical protein